jgi:hypothetical protein
VVLSASAGARHPWIVLRQTGIATNYEVCFDYIGANQITLVVSPSAAFTGGSDTARPTATDEISFGNVNFSSNTDIQHYLHAWQSTDGQCTRFVVYSAGTMRCFAMFEKPQNPISGWTNPSYFIWSTGTTASSYYGFNGKGRGTATMSLALTGEAAGTSFLPDFTDVGTVANSFDSSWTFWPVGMCSTTTSNKGRHGSLFDIWWRPSTLAQADTFPNDANDRQFVCVAGFILPWAPGASTTMLLT